MLIVLVALAVLVVERIIGIKVVVGWEVIGDKKHGGEKYSLAVVVDDENKTTLCSQARHHFCIGESFQLRNRETSPETTANQNQRKSRVVCVECKLGEMLDAAKKGGTDH